jgi:transcription-repair coupling factor (superfamily II helicase)
MHRGREILVKDSVGSLYGAEAAACFYAFLSGQGARNLVLLVPNDSTARRLQDALVPLFEADQGNESAVDILHFPAWDTLPFEVRSPDISIVSERMRALSVLMQHETHSRGFILLCSVPAFAQKVVSPERFRQQQYFSERG